MKWLGTLFSIGAALTLSFHAPSAAAEGLSCGALSYETVIEEQNRINRYFHGAVVPKMLSCWQGLSSQGSVTIRFDYRRDGALWVPVDSALDSSTLPAGQDELALHCLQEAVLDTAFDVTEADGEVQERVVYWNVPERWPSTLPEAVQWAAVDTGGGGGGGESQPKCWDCPHKVGVGSECAKVCVGFNGACRLNPDQRGCNMGPIGTCMSGAAFSNAGGFVMY